MPEFDATLQGLGPKPLVDRFIARSELEVRDLARRKYGPHVHVESTKEVKPRKKPLLNRSSPKAARRASSAGPLW